MKMPVFFARKTGEMERCDTARITGWGRGGLLGLGKSDPGGFCSSATSAESESFAVYV